jgi:WD40 repeat protein
LQRRPPLFELGLPFAILVKVFISLLLTVILAASFVFLTIGPSGKMSQAGTARPTLTRAPKTPFSFFGIKNSTATPAPTFTSTFLPTVLTPPSGINPEQQSPTQLPEPSEIVSIPTDIAAPPPVQAQPSASVTIPRDFTLPTEPFGAENLANLRLVGQLGKGRITQLLWAPASGSSDLFASTTGGYFYMDSSSGTDTGSFYLNSGIITAAISPNGQYLVTSGLDNKVTVWVYGTDEIVTQINSEGNQINSLAFLPDGQTFTGAGADGLVYRWNTIDGGLIQIFDGAESPIRALAISPDGQMLIAGCENRTISMWNVSSGIRFISITAHYKAVNTLAISPDSKIVASSSDDNTFILWDTTNGKQLRLTSVPSAVRSLTFTKDGTGIISGEQDGTVNYWDVATGNLVKIIGKVPGEVNSLSYNNQSTILAIGANTLHLWDVANDSLTTPFKGFTFSTTSLAINKDGTLIASGSQDGRITLWNGFTGEQYALFEGHIGIVSTLEFSPDNRYLASGGADNTILIWDVTTGQKVYVIRGHSGGVRSVAFNMDGSRLISAGGWVDITLKIWDMTTGLGIYNITGFSKGDIELSSKSGTTTLASAGGDGIIRIWNFDTRGLISTMERHPRAVRSIIFSQDGSLLASSSEDGTTEVWDAGDWSVRNSLQTKGSNDLSFSLDNQILIVGGEDIEFWDLASGNLMTEIPGTPGTLTKLAGSSDGRILAAGSTDGSIRLFGIKR